MKTKNCLLLTSAVAMFVSITPAFAQTEPETAAPETVSGDGEEADDGEYIVVTGSRIRRPNIESFEPTVTIDKKYIEERNLTNVADALNELPGFRGSVTPNGAQGSFGQGVNFVNNFGLGSNRTLTLVNGRRFVSSNVPTLFNQGSAGTQVDLNVIPALLTDRIDTVAVGGAPVYGSDAISGTVNVILKTNFTGLTLSSTIGLTEEGDNFRYNLAAVGGMNFADDRGNISFSYSHDRVDGLLFSSREFLRDGLGNITNPSTAQLAALGRPAGTTFANDGRVNSLIGFNDSTTDGFPGTILIRDLTISSLSRNGVILNARNAANALIPTVGNNFQFDGSGNVVAFDRGIPFPGGRSSGGDGFSFNDFSQITSDLQRDIANAFVNFEVSDALQFFVEGTYFRSRGDELVQQPTFNSSLFGGFGGALTFDVNNPFLSAQARNELVSRGVNTFQLSRVSLDLADLTGFSENELYRGVVGAKGDFKLFGRDFNYEVSANYGRTDILDSRQDLNAQNFINAVNVTTVGGQIVCTATPVRQAAPGGVAVVDASCVPLNLFGEGAPSQAARNYVISTNETKSRLEQKVFNANMGGSLFDLFGNSIGVNVGYEHREEKGAFTPSAFEQAGRGRAVAIAPVSGKYNVDEVFGEILVPIVTPQNELSWLNRLEVFGRGRYVDNTVNGGFFSWAAGGTFAPIPDVQFRGNYTKSFRAPAITELFLPVSNAFATVPDLCSTSNRNAGPAAAIRSVNCAAFLTAFPNATPLDAAGATVPSRSGGNSSLDNEVARSFTYGVVVQPSFFPGLSFTADYISIDIDNPISNLTVAQIASGCFDNPDFNTADPANGNAFCSQIRRNPTGTTVLAANGGNGAGQVVADSSNPGVTSGFVNGKNIKFSGVAGSINYETSLEEVGLPGSFEFSGDMLYVRRRVVDITGVAPARSDGVIGDPELSAQFTVRYIGDDFGASTSFNYVGEQVISRFTRTRDTREIDQLNDYFTMNASVYVDVAEKLRLNLAVTNVFDRRGEYYQGELLPASFNDLLGRRFSISARVKY